MTHRKLNGLIAGLVIFYASLIVSGILFGSDGTSDVSERSPASDSLATERERPLTGVGGVAAEDWTASGVVLDADTEEPLSSVSVVAVDDGAEQVSTTTGDDGRFELEDIPATAIIEFSLDGYHPVDRPANADGEYVVSLEPMQITRRVFSVLGNPIQGATIATGDSYTRTGAGGEFSLDGVPDDGEIIAKAAGYETVVTPWDEFDRGFTLTPMTIRGIYGSADVVADERRLNGLLDMIERTELNALVIDVKDSSGTVYYDSQVPGAREAGAVQPAYDAAEVVQKIKDHGAHAIARIAVFADPVLAEARPELAIQDAETGGLWESAQQGIWVNPYQSEVWDYNVQLMQEAVELGFDEIQLSYVQFPDEEPLDRADYGQESTAETRQQAINDFLDHAYAAIGPTATSLTADVPPMTLWDETDEVTGQNLTAMAERLDYVSPMLFPSSFAEGSLDIEVPNDHPHHIVLRSLESGMDILPGYLHPRIRPWLQDFSAETGIRYDESEVREQIDAANSQGVSGWMLWNPENYYHEAALERVE